jgi:amino-acid N-acetyltransferase
VTLQPLGADEQPEVRALLQANGLPTADLGGQVRLFGLRDRQGLEGVVGLELLGEVGLLRSLAVRGDRRQSGLGSQLVLEVERLARAAGVGQLFLLTTTAESFFSHRGYQRLARDRAPQAIQGTSEFKGVCPSSAVLMRRNLETWPESGG